MSSHSLLPRATTGPVLLPILLAVIITTILPSTAAFPSPIDFLAKELRGLSQVNNGEVSIKDMGKAAVHHIPRASSQEAFYPLCALSRPPRATENEHLAGGYPVLSTFCDMVEPAAADAADGAQEQQQQQRATSMMDTGTDATGTTSKMKGGEKTPGPRSQSIHIPHPDAPVYAVYQCMSDNKLLKAVENPAANATRMTASSAKGTDDVDDVEGGNPNLVKATNVYGYRDWAEREFEIKERGRELVLATEKMAVKRCPGRCVQRLKGGVMPVAGCEDDGRVDGEAQLEYWRRFGVGSGLFVNGVLA